MQLQSIFALILCFASFLQVSFAQTPCVSQPNIISKNNAGDNTTVICNGDPLTLSSDISLANCPNCTYEWNNGSTDPFIFAFTPGNYIVTVTDNTLGGCVGVSTQVSITATNLAVPVMTKDSNHICNTADARLEVANVCTNCTYQWFQNTSPPTNALGASTFSFYNAGNVGEYYVEVTSPVPATPLCKEQSRIIVVEERQVTAPPLVVSTSSICDSNTTILSTISCVGCQYEWRFYDFLPEAKLVISGLFDGTRPGNTPAGLELHAIGHINDLSEYSLVITPAGPAPQTSVTYQFPAVALSASSFIYLTDNQDEFIEFFGFAPNYVDPIVQGLDGNDVIELHQGGVKRDVFGFTLFVANNVFPAWTYDNGWAYRKSYAPNATSPSTVSAPAVTFDPNEWTIGSNYFSIDRDNDFWDNLKMPIDEFVASPTPDTAVVISAIFCGTTANPKAKGIELYINQYIPDLSAYSINITENGNSTLVTTVTLPVRAVQGGTYLYLTDDLTRFNSFFNTNVLPLPPNIAAANIIVNTAVGVIDGNDAVEVFQGVDPIDKYGETSYTGAITWNYELGWVKSLSNRRLGNDFNRTEWSIRSNRWSNCPNNNSGDCASTGSQSRLPIGGSSLFDTYASSLVISGVFDGNRGGTPEARGVELYAIDDVDLSLFELLIYEADAATPSAPIPVGTGTLLKGQYLYITSDLTEFQNLFGVAITPVVQTALSTIDGNDAIALTLSSTVVDVVGDITITSSLSNTNYTMNWAYQDGWLYRNSEVVASRRNFNINNWQRGFWSYRSRNDAFSAVERMPVRSYVNEEQGTQLQTIPAQDTSFYETNTTGDYSVSIIYNNGCELESDIVAIDTFIFIPLIEARMPSSGDISNSISYLCFGSTVDLYVSSSFQAPPDWSYQWSRNSVDIANQTGYSFSATAPGRYRVKVVDHNGCTSVSNEIRIINSTNAANPSISASSLYLCSSTDSSILTTSPCVGCVYAWKTESGGTPSSLPFDNRTYNVKGNQAGGYFVSVTDVASGCTYESSILQIKDTIYPSPIMTSSGNTVCSSSSITLGTTSCAGCEYEWQIDTTSVFVTIGVTQQATYQTRESGKYRVRILYPNGCETGYSNTIQATFQTVSANIATPRLTSICNREPVVINALPAYTAATCFDCTYTFLRDSVAMQPDTLRRDSQTITEAGNYQVIVANDKGCADTSAIITFKEVSVSTAIRRSADKICSQNAEVLMEIDSCNNCTYQWIIGASPLITSRDTFYRAIGYAARNGYSVEVTKEGCVIKDSVFLDTVTERFVNITVDINVSPSATMCDGSAVVLVDTCTACSNANQYRYQWFSLTDTLPGASFESYQVDSPGTYFVSTIDNNKCVVVSNAITVQEFLPDPALALDFSGLGPAVPITYGKFLLDDHLQPINLRSRGKYTSLTAQGAIDATTDSINVGVAGSGYHFITYSYIDSNAQGSCTFSTFDTLEVLGAVAVDIVNTKPNVPSSEACIGDVLEITLTNFTFVPDEITFVAGGGNTISLAVSPVLSQFAGVFSGSFTVTVPLGARTGKLTLSDATNSFEAPNFFVIQNPAVTIELVSAIQPICSNLDTVQLRGVPVGGDLFASYIGAPVYPGLMLDSLLFLDSVTGYTNGVQNVIVYYNYVPKYTASDSTCPAILDSLELNIRDAALNSVTYTPISKTQNSEALSNLTLATNPLTAANYPNSYTGTYVLANNLLASTIPLVAPGQISYDSITYEINNGGCTNSSVDSIEIWPAPSLLDSVPVFLCSQDDTVFIQRDVNGVTLRYRNRTILESLYAYQENRNVPIGNPSAPDVRYSEFINSMVITTSNGGVDSVNFFAPNELYYFVPANVTGNSTRITLAFNYTRIANYFSGGSLTRTDTTSYTIAQVSKVFQIEDPSVVSINPAILADTTFCPVNINTQLLGNPGGGKYYLSGGNLTASKALLNNIYNPRDEDISLSYRLTYVYEGRACVDSASTGIYVPDTFSIAVSPNNGTGDYCLTSPNDTVLFTIPYGTRTQIDTSSAQFFIRGIQAGTIFSPSQVGAPGQYNVRYVVSDIYGCSEEATDVFEVFPIPVLSISDIDSVFCLNDDTVQVQLYENSGGSVNITDWTTSGGVPVGHNAVFDGRGVLDGGQMTSTLPKRPYFSPRAAGVGIDAIRYVYEDDNGCMDSINFEIEVLPLPQVAMTTTNRRPLAPYYCENDSIPLFGSPVGTAFNSGYGSFLDSLAPTGLGLVSSLDSANKAFLPNVPGVTPGIVREVLYYYYMDNNGCRDTAFYEVRIRNFTTDPVIVGLDNNGIGSICASDGDIPVYTDNGSGFDLDSLGWFTSSFDRAFSQLTDSAFTDSIAFYPDSTGIKFADRDVTLTFLYTDTSRTCLDSVSSSVTVLALPHLTLSERLVSSLAAMDPIGSKLIAPRTDTFYHICETALDVPIFAYNTTGIYDPFSGNIILNIPDHITSDSGDYRRNLGISRGVIDNGDPLNTAYAYLSANAGFGLDTIRYVYGDARGCIDSVDYYVMIDSLPVLSFAGLSNFDTTLQRYIYCEAEPNPPSILPAPTGVRWTMTFAGQNITSVPFDLLPDTLAVSGVYVDYPLRYDYIGQIYQSGAVCRDSLLDTIQIRPSPQMAWVNAPEDFCMRDSAQRIPLSATPYGGTFVDETNNFQVIAGIVGDSLFNPSAQAGKRDIYYYYKDTTSGCYDTIQHTIYVYTKPQINFDVTGGCSGAQAELTPRTAPYGLQYNGVAIDSITQVIWNLGDGQIDTFDFLPDTLFIPSNNHTYNSFGVFYPSLTVVNQGSCDTTFTRRIVISPKVVPYDSLPYLQPFDNAANGWFQASSDTLSVNGIVSDSLWEWGVMDGNTINTLQNGNRVWGTRLTQTYGQGEDGWVYSPCFDLTNLERPMIKLDIWRATQEGVDGAVLQYFDDSTQAWKVLGKHGKGINWYQDDFVVSSPGNQIGAIPVGWTGKNITWEDARYRLDNIGSDLRGRDNVRFRIAFASDPGTLLNANDGFAFDNVKVGNRTRNVLVEHFSSVGYPGIEGIERQLYHTIYNNLYGRDVNLVQYHLNDYLPSDPLYALNPTDNRQRRFIYNITSSDEVRVDGKLGANKTSDLLSYPELEVLDVEALEDAKFKIEFIGFPSVQYNGPNSGMQATVRVTALQDMPASVYSVMATVTKDSLVTLTGHTTMAVMLANFPNNVGTIAPSVWAAGDQFDVNISLPSVNPSMHPNTSLLQLVVYVQDIDANPKEIYQVETTRNLNIFTGGVDSLDVSVTDLPGVEATQFKLFPNPAVQQFQIAFETPLEDAYEWQLVNALGQPVRRGEALEGTDNIYVDTDDLTAGFYVFIISNKNVYAQRKVIIKKP